MNPKTIPTHKLKIKNSEHETEMKERPSPSRDSIRVYSEHGTEMEERPSPS